jgi:predicted Zn-dependent peptidase
MKCRTAATIQVVLVTLTLSLAGCFWLGGEKEMGPIRDDRPRAIQRKPEVQPETPKIEPGEPARPNVLGQGIPTIVRPNWRPLFPELSMWAGGLRTFAIPIVGDAVFVEAIVAHRQAQGGKSLIAELTAQLIADSPRDGGATPSLRQRLGMLGGELEFDVSLTTTRYRVSVPSGRLEAALVAFAETFADPPTSSDRVDAARRLLLSRVTERWRRAPLDTTLDRVGALELRGVDDWLAVLEDATTIDVKIFQQDNYQPSRVAIGVAGWWKDQATVDGYFAKAFGPWLDRNPGALPDVIPPPLPSAGAFWSEGTWRPRVAIAFDLPPPHLPDASAHAVLVEHLGGPGGPIERAVRDAVGNSARVVRRLRHDGLRRWFTVEFEADENALGRAWEAIREAFAAATSRRPSLSESSAAGGRARSRLALALREPSAALELAIQSAFTGLLPSRILDAKGQVVQTADASAGLLESVTALSRPEQIDVTKAMAEYSRRQPFMVVSGGTSASLARPWDHVTVPGGFLPAERHAAVNADLDRQREDARAILEKSVIVTASDLKTILNFGFISRSTTRSGRGAESSDLEFFHADGRYRRVRHVLETTIETLIDKSLAIEQCGNERHNLEPDDVASLLAPLQRHPIRLLSQWSLGNASYRAVSRRTHDGREMVVLERENDGGEPLRLMLDAESGLVRVVSYHEDRPNGRVYVRDEWRDYRDIGGGIRAPHHRTTFIDDGDHGLVTRWLELRSIAPTDEMLKLGGAQR